MILCMVSLLISCFIIKNFNILISQIVDSVWLFKTQLRCGMRTLVWPINSAALCCQSQHRCPEARI